MNVTGCAIVGLGPNGGVDGIVYSHSATLPLDPGIVTGNEITNCEMGICLDHDGLDFTVTGNTLEGCRKAISVGSESTATITGNTVTDSTDMGVEVFKVGTTVNYNNIVGSANYGVWLKEGAEVDAKYNWWGGIGGPGDEGLGKGDSVSTNVDYDPWLTEDYTTTIDEGIAYFGSTIPLEPGWNTLSVPLKLRESANTLVEIMDLGDFLTNENVQLVYQYDPDPKGTPWQNIGASDTELVPGRGYYIKILGTGTVDFPVLYSSEWDLPTLELSAGWNLIGSGFGINKTDYGIAATDEADGQKDVATALYSIKDKCSVVVSPSTQGQVAAWGTTVIDDTKFMIVGEAYWVFMTAPATLAGFEVTPIYYLP